MLESTSMSPVGVVFIDNAPQIIYCDMDKGECAYELPSMDIPQAIVGVSAMNAMECNDLETLTKSVEKSPYIGIILQDTGNHIFIIDEGSAFIGKITDKLDNVQIFEIDMQCDYEIDFEDIDYV